MSPEKTKELFDKFPLLFAGRTKPMTETLMCLGFDCGDGWFDLINGLCEKIDAIFQKSGLTQDEYPKAVQVKEKFGGLRFYMEGMNNAIFDEVYKVTDEAEEASLKICEKCGKPDECRDDLSWISTLCDEHHNARTKK